MKNNMCLLTVLAAAACGGCIERTMQIRTDPPGAMVWVDDELCGTTPVEVPFTSYGTRRIILQMESRQTRCEKVKLRAPWYCVFPIDFATDVLCPFIIHDDKSFHYAMEPLVRTDTKELEQRASEFAEQSRAMLAEERRKRGVPDPAGAKAEPDAAAPPAVETPPAKN